MVWWGGGVLGKLLFQSLWYLQVFEFQAKPSSSDPVFGEQGAERPGSATVMGGGLFDVLLVCFYATVVLLPFFPLTADSCFCFCLEQNNKNSDFDKPPTVEILRVKALFLFHF